MRQTSSQPSKPNTTNQLDSTRNTDPNQVNSLTLRGKLLSIMLPTILLTLATVSFAGYKFIQQEEKNQAKSNLENQALFSGEATVQFLEEKLTIAELIAKNPTVINSARQAGIEVSQQKLDKQAIANVERIYNSEKLLQPQQQLNDLLRSIVESTQFTEISYTEKHGFNVAYNVPTKDLIQRDEYWWKQAQKNTEWIGAADSNLESNKIDNFNVVKAIQDPQTGEFLGVVKTSLPISEFKLGGNYIKLTGSNNSNVAQIISLRLGRAIQTIDNRGLNNDAEIIGGYDLVKIIKQVKSNQSNIDLIKNNLDNNFNLKELIIKKVDNKLSVSFRFNQRFYSIATTKHQDWISVTSTNYAQLSANSQELIPLLLITSLSIGLVATVVCAVVAKQISEPLVNLADVAQQVAAGDLDANALALGTVETKTLSHTFNTLIDRVNQLLNAEKIKTQQAELLKNLTIQFTVAFNPEEIISTAVAEAREALQSDRSLYYQFVENLQGKVIAESVLSDLPALKDAATYAFDLTNDDIEQYKQGTVKTIDDFARANLTDSQLQQLEVFTIRASMVAPVMIQDKLDGLLIVHQCSTSRDWQPNEIELLTQLAYQVSFALTRIDFSRQQQQAETREKQAREAIQSRALDLLREVYDVSEGNLTIRARVTEDEIGTIADSYNSTIASLQKLVDQVKVAASEVKVTTGDNELAVQKMAQETILQAEEISETLQQIEEMSASIQTVSANATQAEDFVRVAGETIAAGDRAMDLTVTEINAIQTTVTETVAKVKQLGDSSQEISQAVNLIGRFAAQTHLLALKASIEAARAGDRGKGFAVIADEVRSLASQSAAATSEIDNLVTKIQLETNDVLAAMNLGTQQVAKGTQLVQQTRASLDRVNVVSAEISRLVKAISEAAIRQSETSSEVSTTITNVAEIARNNSQSAIQVSTSIQQLSTVAEKLQAGIGKFKT